MKRRLNYFIAVLIVSFSLISLTCKYGLSDAIYRSDSVKVRSVSMLTLNDAQTQAMLSGLGSAYKVLIITDMHYGKKNKSQNEDKLLAWLDSQTEKPAFCINLGDTADHGYASELDSYLDFQTTLSAQFPVYNIVGNHDLYNSGWSVWKEKIYPHTSFYHFETNGLSWYFLDSGSGTLGVKQLEEFENAMKVDSKPKVVSLHYPVYSDKINMMSYFTLQNQHEVDRLFSIFRKYNVKFVLDGHTHKFFMNDFGSFTEFNVGSIMQNGSWGVVSVDETKLEVKGENIRR